jgi:hypothetical protein
MVFRNTRSKDLSTVFVGMFSFGGGRRRMTGILLCCRHMTTKFRLSRELSHFWRCDSFLPDGNCGHHFSKASTAVETLHYTGSFPQLGDLYTFNSCWGDIAGKARLWKRGVSYVGAPESPLPSLARFLYVKLSQVFGLLNPLEGVTLRRLGLGTRSLWMSGVEPRNQGLRVLYF